MFHYDLLLRRTSFTFSILLDYIRYNLLPYKNNRFLVGERIYKDFLGFSRKVIEDLSGKTILEIGSGNMIIPGILFAHHEKVGKYILSEPFMYFPVEKNIQIAYDELKEKNYPIDEFFTIKDKTIGLNTSKLEINRDMLSDLKNISSESVDLIISNAVFEHIQREHMESATREMYRVLKSGGYMIHQVDLRDHGYYFRDNYAFLRYSEDEWDDITKIANYSVFWANRLRCIDFEKIFGEKFIITESIRQKYTNQSIKSTPIHKDLKEKYTEEELEVEGLLIYCQKK